MCLAMVGLHRKGKVVVSVNRVGMACGEVDKSKWPEWGIFFYNNKILHLSWGSWWLELWGW
jgi:hypothetical protein